MLVRGGQVSPALRWLWAGSCACPGVPLSESGFSRFKDFQDEGLLVIVNPSVAFGMISRSQFLRGLALAKRCAPNPVNPIIL